MTADAILLDDNIWIRDQWDQTFRKNGKRIHCYSTPNAFINDLGRHSKKVPIFIDYRFKNLHRNGGEIAAMAFKKGFKKLYITSQHKADEMEVPDCVKDIVDKTPPIWLLSTEKSLSQPLESSRKSELFSLMSPSQRLVFRQRMMELYSFLNQQIDPMFSPFESQTSTCEWEKAIYEGASDQKISRLRLRCLSH